MQKFVFSLTHISKIDIYSLCDFSLKDSIMNDNRVQGDICMSSDERATFASSFSPAPAALPDLLLHSYQQSASLIMCSAACVETRGCVSFYHHVSADTCVLLAPSGAGGGVSAAQVPGGAEAVWLYYPLVVQQ